MQESIGGQWLDWLFVATSLPPARGRSEYGRHWETSIINRKITLKQRMGIS